VPRKVFIAGRLAQFQGGVTPAEVLTGPVKPFRNAEREGHFGRLLAMLAAR